PDTNVTMFRRGLASLVQMVSPRGRRTQSPPAEPVMTPLMRLLHAQQADGRFDAPGEPLPDGWVDAVATAERWLSERKPAAELRTRPQIVATLAALILLQRRFASERASWKRAAEKGLRYLALQLGVTVKIVRTEIAWTTGTSSA